MLGLNNAHISRVTDLPPCNAVPETPRTTPKATAPISWSARPTIIIAGYADGLPIDESPFLGDQQLSQSAEFARCYERREANIPANGNAWMLSSGRGDALTLLYYQRICGGETQMASGPADLGLRGRRTLVDLK